MALGCNIRDYRRSTGGEHRLIKIPDQKWVPAMALDPHVEQGDAAVIIGHRVGPE
ncbi:MAG: hypothetical protein KDB26_02720 [Microthrixaceae bacterium]|nr:hypothetical protein [Microthrixaceae bacterium]